MLPLSLALLALLSPSFAAPVVAPVGPLPQLDWKAAGEESARVLAGYLQVDTQNPPGNESDGVRYLGGILDKEGISWEMSEYAPGRGSLIARLNGSGAEKPLCMLSHVDVVTAEPARWSHPPLSGLIEDGYVWGRGALDMKGMGVTELMTMIWLKRLNAPLIRDVILLAVADEEVDGAGVEHIAKQWDKIGCSQLVNEGGLGIKDLFFAGQTVFAISNAEKGAMWVKMVASGAPGHGSTPTPGRAPEHLKNALDRLAERKDVVIWDDALMETFRRVGKQHGGMTGSILQSPGLVKLLVKPKLMAGPPTHAALTNTVNVTGFGGAMKPNVVPSEVWAVLDVRILPGTKPEAMLAELATVVNDPAIRFDVISATEGSRSPYDDTFFNALAARAVAGRDDAAAGPVMSVGYTDSNALRPLGVHAYGFVPFEVEGADLGTMHGDNERVSIANLENGLKILLGAVMDVSVPAGAIAGLGVVAAPTPATSASPPAPPPAPPQP